MSTIENGYEINFLDAEMLIPWNIIPLKYRNDLSSTAFNVYILRYSKHFRGRNIINALSFIWKNKGTVLPHIVYKIKS